MWVKRMSYPNINVGVWRRDIRYRPPMQYRPGGVNRRLTRVTQPTSIERMGLRSPRRGAFIYSNGTISHFPIATAARNARHLHCHRNRRECVTRGPFAYKDDTHDAGSSCKQTRFRCVCPGYARRRFGTFAGISPLMNGQGANLNRLQIRYIPAGHQPQPFTVGRVVHSHRQPVGTRRQVGRQVEVVPVRHHLSRRPAA